MQVNSINNQPSFGMAKLTSKGRVAAKAFVSELPKFYDATVYQKKNILGKLLSEVSKGSAEPGAIDAFFKQAQTPYATLNQQFVDKQILTLRGKRAIKKFLGNDHARAAKALADNQEKVYESSLTTKGGELVDSIISVFDRNINNPEISAKKGKGMLDLVKRYIAVEDLTKRTAVVSEKILSK